MAIDTEELVLSARSLLTSEDAALKFPLSDFYAALPLTVDAWNQRNRELEAKGLGRKIPVTTSTIRIINGQANVKTAIEAVGMLPEKVKQAEIFLTYGATPPLSVRFVNSRDRLNFTGTQDKFFINAHFDGDKMFFAPVADTPLNNVDFTITADGNPTSIDAMPADVSGEIAIILAELMRKYNTDTEHKGVQRRMSQK